MDLDLREVGDRLMRLVALSAALGHAEPAYTLTYAHTGPGTEAEFVTDVLGGMSTAKLAEKWFGGMGGLLQLAGMFIGADEIIGAAVGAGS